MDLQSLVVEQPFTGHRFCYLLPLERFNGPQDYRRNLKKAAPVVFAV